MMKLRQVNNLETVHDEKLHNKPSSPHIIRMMKSKKIAWAWQVVRVVKMKYVKILVTKPEGEGPLGRSRRR
jgi:hypothetical protein